MLELVHGAREVEPDFDVLARTGASERRIGARLFATNFVARGFARPNVDVDTINDLVWVPYSPQVYLLHVRENQLSNEEYQRWLADSLELCLVTRN